MVWCPGSTTVFLPIRALPAGRLAALGNSHSFRDTTLVGRRGNDGDVLAASGPKKGLVQCREGYAAAPCQFKIEGVMERKVPPLRKRQGGVEIRIPVGDGPDLGESPKSGADLCFFQTPASCGDQ